MLLQTSEWWVGKGEGRCWFCFPYSFDVSLLLLSSPLLWPSLTFVSLPLLFPPYFKYHFVLFPVLYFFVIPRCFSLFFLWFSISYFLVTCYIFTSLLYICLLLSFPLFANLSSFTSPSLSFSFSLYFHLQNPTGSILTIVRVSFDCTFIHVFRFKSGN